MTRQSLAKQQTFGVPSLAAHYLLTARMRELEHQFEAKAAELRTAYLNECALAQGD
jgi:hypothetical protein